MTARPRAATWFALVLPVVLWLAGCDELGLGLGGPAQPPAETSGTVQAFGSVIALADGTTAARLEVVVPGATPRHATGVTGPAVGVGAARVPLGTTSQVGVFESSSRVARALEYSPGSTYTFSFAMPDGTGAEQAYTAAVTAPARSATAELRPATVYLAGEPVEVDVFNSTGAALIVVTGPNGWSWSSAVAATLADAPALAARFLALPGPVEVIPGAAFPAAGVYRITFTGLSVTTTGLGGLAAGSWLAAGPSVALDVEVR